MKKEFLTFRSNLKRSFFLLLLAGLQLAVNAQNIDFSAGCPNAPSDLTDQVAGQAVSGIPTITAVNSPGGAPFTIAMTTIDVTLGGFSTGEGCGPCASPVNIHGLTFTASGTDFTVTGTPDNASIGYNYSITLTATPNPGSPCSKTYTFDITRRPIDLMMVLDKSGSMGTIISGSQTRYVKLKDGVAEFLANYQPQLLAVGGANGDQMGIRMFSSTDAAPVNAPFNVNNFIPVTPATNTAGILDGDNPTGATAMGPGLLTGSSFLFPGGADNGHKKAMLVFTDGEQNVPPNVVAAAGSNPTVSGTDLTNGDKVQIHTIGLGLPGPATQTLYNMANESGGITNIANALPATAPDLNLGIYLTNISTELLSGSSPQNVDISRSNFKFLGESFGTEEEFVVSKQISKVFVNFITSITNEARINSIEKDGKAISLFDTGVVKSRSGNGWQTFIINVAALKRRDTSFKSEGTWKVSAFSGSQSAGKYILALIVDDHNSKMRGATTQTKELIVGDKLPLSIELTKRGSAITNATAIAVVAKPGDDMGDLLARTNLDFKLNTDPDADNAGAQKLEELLKDSAFAKKLLDSNHTVTLTFDAAQNKYVGEFGDLDLSGVYQVAYIVSVNDPDLGDIRRYSEESIYVRFPEVDLDNSEVIFTATPQPGISILTFRPIATNGKFIGPGWSGGIVLTGDNVKVNNIVDSGNGTYTLTIQGDPAKDVTVSIGTDTVYTGPLGDIGKGGGAGGDIFKAWWFWLIIIVILIIIWIILRRKNNP